MMVIMALVTTAMTGPINEFLWFRHQEKKELKRGAASENYLTLTFDDDPIHKANNPVDMTEPGHLSTTPLQLVTVTENEKEPRASRISFSHV